MSRGVFVYRNLARKGVVWSVKSRITGLVIARRHYVFIKNAKLKVSQAGRARVLKEKRKNVHAGVTGTWVRDKKVIDNIGRSLNTDVLENSWQQIKYNPRDYSSFVTVRNEKPVTTAELVVIGQAGVWALNPR